MDRYRLISTIVILLFYLLFHLPLQTIVAAVFIGIAYFAIRQLKPIERNDTAAKRRASLQMAKMFLAPYDNIWNNLRLSNKYCVLRLGRDGTTITARDSVNGVRSLRVVKSKVHPVNDLWDMLCLNFDYNTTFDGLIELFNRFDVKVNIIGMGTSADNTGSFTNIHAGTVDNVPQKIIKPEKKELLDVNNASEVELTALPGVSIVMAKKLTKKREEIGGFKSVADVCLFLHLKPHMQAQLEQLICVKKMKGSIKVKRYDERKIDL